MTVFYFVVYLQRGKKCRADIVGIEDNKSVLDTVHEIEKRYKGTPTKIKDMMVAASERDAHIFADGCNEICAAAGEYLTVFESRCTKKQWKKHLKNKKKLDALDQAAS